MVTSCGQSCGNVGSRQLHARAIFHISDFGDRSVAIKTYRWYGEFTPGRRSFYDEFREGLSKLQLVSDTIDDVRKLLLQERLHATVLIFIYN